MARYRVPFRLTFSPRILCLYRMIHVVVKSVFRRGSRVSDSGVPGVAAFWRSRAQAFAEVLQTIRYGEASDVFDALVAELPGNTQSKRSAKSDGKLTAIHAVGDESLRVQCIGHVDAFPPVGLNGTVDNVSGLGQRPHTSRT